MLYKNPVRVREPVSCNIALYLNRKFTNNIHLWSRAEITKIVSAEYIKYIILCIYYILPKIAWPVLFVYKTRKINPTSMQWTHYISLKVIVLHVTDYFYMSCGLTLCQLYRPEVASSGKVNRRKFFFFYAGIRTRASTPLLNPDSKVNQTVGK